MQTLIVRFLLLKVFLILFKILCYYHIMNPVQCFILSRICVFIKPIAYPLCVCNHKTSHDPQQKAFLHEHVPLIRKQGLVSRNTSRKPLLVIVGVLSLTTLQSIQTQRKLKCILYTPKLLSENLSFLFPENTALMSVVSD